MRADGTAMSSEVLRVVHEKELWLEDRGSHGNCDEDDVPWPDIERQEHEEAVRRRMAEKKARRKSWHAIRFERKRRKGVVQEPQERAQQEEASEEGQLQEAEETTARQKRPSWWNIFAGQQWPRFERFCKGGTNGVGNVKCSSSRKIGV